ncbi:hypothetical protein AAMO2058_001196200 [Amorphochlora amoebiformis]
MHIEGRRYRAVLAAVAWGMMMESYASPDIRENKHTDQGKTTYISKRLHSLSPVLRRNLAEIVGLTIRFRGETLSDEYKCLLELAGKADAEFTKTASESALAAMWSTDDGIDENKMLEIFQKTVANADMNESGQGKQPCHRVSSVDKTLAFERLVLALAKSTMLGSSARFQGLQSSTDQLLLALFPEYLVGWGLCFLIVCAMVGFTTTCYNLVTCRFTRKKMRFRSPIDKGMLVKGKELGAGGFGSVFLCQVKGRKERRVVKMIQVDMDDMSAVQEALEEAKKLISLRHPNIVQYIDVFLHRQSMGELTVSEYVCIVMEHCDGGCLRDLMEKPGILPLSPKQILHAFHQVCLGLASTHDMGIVHTDIKLENIMVCIRSWGMEFKIGDYGLAVHINNDADEANKSGTTPGLLRVASQLPHTSKKKQSRKRKLTEKGHVSETMGGTPAYVPPEVFEAFDHFSEDSVRVNKYDSVLDKSKSVVAFPVDIWALAWVLYELAGLEVPDEEPFPGQLALDKDAWPETRDQMAMELLKALQDPSYALAQHEDGKMLPNTPKDVDEDEDIDEKGKEKGPDVHTRLKEIMKGENVGSDEWIKAGLVKTFHSMLERSPAKRPTIKDILRSSVFMVLPPERSDRTPTFSMTTSFTGIDKHQSDDPDSKGFGGAFKAFGAAADLRLRRGKSAT